MVRRKELIDKEKLNISNEIKNSGKFKKELEKNLNRLEDEVKILTEEMVYVRERFHQLTYEIMEWNGQCQCECCMIDD